MSRNRRIISLLLAAALALSPIAAVAPSPVFAVASMTAAAPADVEILADPYNVASWTHENHGGATSTFTSDGKVLKLTIGTKGTENWHVQLYQAGKAVIEGQKYTLRFDARADQPMPLSLTSMIDVADYSSLGIYETLALTPAWKTFEFTFTATGVGTNTARLPTFQAGTTPGTIELRNLSVLGPVVTKEPPMATAKLPDSFFPFVIPWDDASKGVATDLSALNHANQPLPRIEARGGHFYEAGTGKRVRFWATNFGAGEAFPDKASADAVAARLAKYGVNLVRLHHLDNPWAIASGGSIWDRNQQKKVIDPAQLDKLHYLIAALAKNGVYTNLNLKVSKQLSAADGAPEGTEALSSATSMAFQKKVDRFHRFFIDQQKAYAKQILTTPNPYRNNQTLAADPAIAFVEINNENAAAGWPGEAPGAGLTQLPPVFREDLRSQWVRYLRAKYTSHAKLLAAWKSDADRPGTTILTPALRWTANTPGDSEITAGPGPADKPEPTDAPPEAQFQITRTSGTEWHAQGILAPLPALQDGKTYTLEFTAQASPPRPLRISIDRNSAPWDNQGLNGTVEITEDWSTHRLVFQAGDAPNQRIALQLGSRTGRVGIRDVKLYTGVGGEPVASGESLDTGNLSLPSGAALPTVQKDWQLFITDVDRRFAEEMLDYLQKDLGVKGLIADTQIQWGSLGGIAREARMSWTDSHAYWNHPTFTGGDWNPRNWTVNQAALTSAFGTGDFGTLGDLAIHRVTGKPFSVSEYDHPAPNDFVSEMMPMVSSWGALQDWDKIYTFAYAEFAGGKNTDRIQGFFDQGSHPAKWAFNPSAALIFREGLIPPLAAASELYVPKDAHGLIWSVPAAWRRGGGVPDLLTHRVSLGTDATATARFSIVMPPMTSPASPSKASVAKGPHGPVYLAQSPRAFVATGFLGGYAFDAGPFKLSVAEFGNQFASLTIVPLDGQPLATSKRMLLTVLGRAENVGMGWNATRTTVSDQWGTGPVHVEGIPAALTLPPNLTVYPLDPTGKRKPALKVDGSNVTLSPAAQTVWYEITAP